MQKAMYSNIEKERTRLGLNKTEIARRYKNEY